MSDEVQLLLKTAEARLGDLCDVVAELHSYELPELLVLSADAENAYGRWIASTVKRPPRTDADSCRQPQRPERHSSAVRVPSFPSVSTAEIS